MTNPLDVKQIFKIATSIADSAERRAYLDSACGQSHPLRPRVDALLAAHEADQDLFERGAPVSDLADDPAQLGIQSGSTIGRYKVLEQIGEGGFGVVYMAEQTKPIRRRVALKVIKAGMDTKQVIGRFEAERQALALMDHPHIAKVLDAGATESGLPYFVMELVHGIPVTDYCDDRELSTQDRLQVFTEICSAIQHAHQKGIIHRDIKPSNILVSTNGDRPVPKVIDFGIAKATHGRLTDKTLFTQFRQFVGSPVYMSPEQAQMSAVDVDSRSDIYSLGVLLYELIVGQTPFNSQELLGAGFEAMCRKIREEEPASPSSRLSKFSHDEKTTIARQRRAQEVELERTIRGELDWIVMKAIAKDRTHRYESADALKQDIQRFLANEPVLAAAPSTTYRARKFVHRNKTAIVAATLFMLMLTSATVVSTWLAIRATRQTERAAAAERTALQNLELASDNLKLAKYNELASRRNQYAAEMMVAQSGTDGVSSENVYEILKRHIPDRGAPDFRGFEWRRLWNNNHRRELFALVGHTDEIRSVAMSPDGRWLASGATDGTARLWDLTAHREVWQTSKGKHCNQVEFSPDGRQLLTSWWGPSRAILWEVSDPGRPVELRDLAFFGSFSPDGETAITSSEPLRQWHLDSGEELHRYSDPALVGTRYEGRSHRGGRWQTVFSADGVHLLTIGQDRMVKLWNTSDGRLELSIDAQTDVMDGALSPSDKTIATVSMDHRRIQIWNRQGLELQDLELGNPLDRVCFSADGSKLVVSESSGRVHVFDTQTWEEAAVFDSRGSIDSLRVCSTVDPKVVVTASRISLTNAIRFWDISARDTVLQHALPVRTLKFAHNGTVLAVGMVNGAVQFWSVANRSAIFTTDATRSVNFDIRERPALTPYKPGFVQFSPDDRKAAIMGPPHAITIWDIHDQQPASAFRIPDGEGTIKSLSFSPTGEFLYAGTDGSGIVVWKVSEPDTPAMTLAHPGAWSVDCLTWAPTGNLLASGRTDVRLWDPPHSQPVRTLDMSNLPLMNRGTLSLDFSPSAKWLAGGTPAGTIWLWNTDAWTYDTLPLNNYVMSVNFSPDSQRLVAAESLSAVKVWDVESRQTVATFKGSMAEFSPDGTLLAVGCETRLGSLQLPESGRVRLYYAPPLAELDAELLRKAEAP